MLGIHWRIARTGNDTEGQWKIRCWPAWTQQLTSIYPCHKVLSFPWKVEVWLRWIHRKRRGEIWRWEFDNMASSFEWLVLFYSSEDSYVSFSWSKTEGWRCEKGGRGLRQGGLWTKKGMEQVGEEMEFFLSTGSVFRFFGSLSIFFICFHWKKNSEFFWRKNSESISLPCQV